MDIPIYFLTALLGTFCYAIDGVSTKLLMQYIKNPITLMFYQFSLNLFIVFFTFLFLLFTGTNFNSMWNLENLIILIISAILIFSGVVSIYYGLNIGNVSVATVVLSSRVLFVIPIGFLFLGEIYPSMTYLWIGVIVLGVLFVSWEENFSLKDVLSFKGTYYYLLANVFFAIANSLIRLLDNKVSFVAIVLIRLIVLTSLIELFGSFLNNKFSYPKINKNLSSRFVIIIFLQILIIFIGDLSYIYSLGESVTITEAIGSLQSLFVFIMILLLSKVEHVKANLNEKLDHKTLSVRIFGMLLATIGTIGIALAV